MFASSLPNHRRHLIGRGVCIDFIDTCSSTRTSPIHIPARSQVKSIYPNCLPQASNLTGEDLRPVQGLCHVTLAIQNTTLTSHAIFDSGHLSDCLSYFQNRECYL